MNITRIILSAVLAALLAATGGGKLAGAASSRAIRHSLRVSPERWKAIGAGEMLLVAGLIAGLWFRPLGIAATAGVVVLMAGAIFVRRSVGGPEQRSGIAADAVVMLLAFATIGVTAAA